MIKIFTTISFLFFVFANAHDFLLWTPNGGRLIEDDSPSALESALLLSSPTHPTFIVGLHNFSLDLLTSEQKEEFAVLIDQSKYHQMKDLGTLELPVDVSANEKGIHFEEFENVDDFLSNSIAIDQQSTLIVSDSNAFTHHGVRVKRVTLNEDDSDRDARPKSRKPQRPASKGVSRNSGSSRRLQQGKAYSFPIVLPPFNRDALTPKDAQANRGSCLLYLESLVVFVFNKKSKEPIGCGATIGSRTGGHKFIFTADSVNCIQEFTPGEGQSFSFNIDVEIGKPVEANCREKSLFTIDGTISAKLTFETTPTGGWQLVDVNTDGFRVNANNDEWLNRDLSVAGGKATQANVLNMNIGAPLNYNFGCSRTKSVVFETNDNDYDVGLVFENLQIQPGGYQVDGETDTVRFTMRTFDCVGTFSAESLMGIIVSLLLVSVFIFGFLMLNSVQSVDRFDDPKQKQLSINARE